MNATKSLFLCAMCATASVIGAGCGDTNKGEGAAADAGKTDAAEAAEATPADVEITDETVVAEVDGEKLTLDGETDLRIMKRELNLIVW